MSISSEKDFQLRWMAFETTRLCNLRCVHCRSSSDETPRADELNTAEVKTLINHVSSFAKPVFVLSGGEPLLRDDVFEIARHGTETGLRMCIATNGLLVSDEVCNKMKESGIRMVSLSIDGTSPEVHDDFRQQKGVFNAAVRATKLLKKHDIKFLINSSFTKRNQSEIEKTYRLAKTLGATAWYMFLIVPTGRGADILEELVSREDYEKILRWHAEMEFEEKDMLVRPTCAPQYYRVVRQVAKERGIKYEHRALSFGTGGSKGCVAGQSICLVDAIGNVLPCSYFPQPAGNVRETPLSEIWENAPLFKSLRDFTGYKDRCGACEYLQICGGCRARSLAITGDFLAEEPFCPHLPVRKKKKKAATDV